MHTLTGRDIEHLLEKLELMLSVQGRWLTVKEAMDYAKVKSRSTLMKWIDAGYIYAHKRTGEWIIDRNSIDDWYNSERY